MAWWSIRSGCSRISARRKGLIFSGQLLLALTNKGLSREDGLRVGAAKCDESLGRGSRLSGAGESGRRHQVAVVWRRDRSRLLAGSLPAKYRCDLSKESRELIRTRLFRRELLGKIADDRQLEILALIRLDQAHDPGDQDADDRKQPDHQADDQILTSVPRISEI